MAMQTPQPRADREPWSRDRRKNAAKCVAAWLVAGLTVLLPGCGDAETPIAGQPARAYEGRRLVVFVGSASQPPTQLAVQRFQELTGARVEAHFGGSGEMLARMKLADRGDVYFPGSSDYIELAKREGLVDPASETIVAYMVPAINVPRDNPKGIHSLEDLARPGVRVAIARPDTVCVGLYAVEALERAGLASAVRPNIVNHAESCAKTAQVVALGQVDAVLGWEVFEHWEPAKIRTIYLPNERVPRIGFLPAAIGTGTKDGELARAFLDFLTSAEGRAIYEKWNYLTSVDEARRHALPDTPVGGEWPLPEGW
ncbi:MAG: molybdate ABC transporter substrate-binding protein [Phycisphaeraceae bacterium]|nr:molybdate ABC transporter substrate-binding protein [Phycisphaeraceae bacterium]